MFPFVLVPYFPTPVRVQNFCVRQLLYSLKTLIMGKFKIDTEKLTADFQGFAENVAQNRLALPSVMTAQKHTLGRILEVLVTCSGPTRQRTVVDTIAQAAQSVRETLIAQGLTEIHFEASAATGDKRDKNISLGTLVLADEPADNQKYAFI